MKRIVSGIAVLTLLVSMLLLENGIVETSYADPETILRVDSEYIDYTNFLLQVKSYQTETWQGDGVTYFELPINGPPTEGILYDSHRGVIWSTLCNETRDVNGNIETEIGFIVMFNVTDNSILVFELPFDVGEGFYGPIPWTIDLDNNGEIWLSIITYFSIPEQLPENIPCLAKLNPENNTLTVFWIPKEYGWMCDVKFYEGFTWCHSEYYLLRLNASIITGFWRISDTSSEGFMFPDGGYIWITRTEEGEVRRFNVMMENFDVNLTGFSEPFGIHTDTKYVYIAEYNASAIAIINKLTLAVSRIPIESKPSYVCRSNRGNIWWLSSYSLGVISELTCYTYEINCRGSTPIIESPNNKLWFGAVKIYYYLGPPYIVYKPYLCVIEDIDVVESILLQGPFYWNEIEYWILQIGNHRPIRLVSNG